MIKSTPPYADKHPAEKKSNASGWRSGILAGTADTMINYPAYGLAYRLQRGKIITLSAFQLKELYRGAMPFSMGYIPSIMIEDGVTTFCKNELGLVDGPYTQGATAFASGIISAIPMTWIGNMIITQQKQSLNSYQAIQKLLQQPARAWMLGFTPTAARDAIFATVMFSCIDPQISYTQSAKTMLAPGILGSLGAALSQPAATLATKMQEDQAPSAWQKARQIIHEEGVKGLYRGLGLRTLSFIGSAYVVPWISHAAKQTEQEHDNSTTSMHRKK